MERMPTRRWIVLRLLCAFVCCSIAAFGGLLCCLPQTQVEAAPHTISSSNHPYDADWLDVYLILANKCFGCHRANMDRSDLSSYESLMQARSADGFRVVVPGKASESLLWRQVCWNAEARADSGKPDRPEMPLKREEWLTEGQQRIIRRWIDNGALQIKIPDFDGTPPLTEVDFPSAKQCATCHPKQYDEWSRSMHAYAQHSPVMEAFQLTLVERTSGTMGTFCTRCHTPIGIALGENGSRRNVNRSRISMEGITCVVCHRRESGRYKSSGRVRIEPGKLLDTCVYGPFDDPQQPGGVHHAAGMPYIKTSQFCGECHDVTSPEGVRLEEAFSEWLNSPAAKAGITCQQCHMGPEQGVPLADDGRPLGRAAVVPGVDPESLPLRRLSDHTFAGPDYSLLPDTEFPHKLDWMYETDYRDVANLTPYQQKTLKDLRRSNREHLRIATSKRYELLRNAAEISVAHPRGARPGQRVIVDVDVTSKFSGHGLPTGFTAERQVWVAVEVRDPRGGLVFASGDLDDNHDLRDEHSHQVMTGRLPHDPYLLNFQSKFITLTNKGTERSVVVSVNRHLAPLNILRPATGISASFGRPHGFRVSKGNLPPLKTIGQRYPVSLPREAGEYTVDVRLNFRHLPPTLLDHVGVPHLKHLLEVVVIDEYRGTINVTH